MDTRARCTSPTIRVLSGAEELSASPAEPEAAENDEKDDYQDDPTGGTHDSS